MPTQRVQGSCHCGAIHLEVDAAPVTVTDCNCSICRRYGVLWAYYEASQVRVSAAAGAEASYQWGDKTIEFRRCKVCGCVTRWTPIDPARTRTGVNARLLDLAVLAAARVRKLDGAGTEEYLDEA
jgi:hypothetical protein